MDAGFERKAKRLTDIITLMFRNAQQCRSEMQSSAEENCHLELSQPDRKLQEKERNSSIVERTDAVLHALEQ